MLRLVAVLVTIALASPAIADGPLLLVNGRILLDAPAPAESRFADAALISEGRFVAVGTRAEAERAAREAGFKPRLIDLRGRFAVPSLTDAHGHVENLGFLLQRLKLVGTRSEDEIVAMVASEVKRRPKGEWILGRGWDQNDWADMRFPTRESLDRVAPDHPVWLRRVDGHASWANSKALAIAGVTKHTPDPAGGKIHHLDDGTPSGVFVDNAMALVELKIPQPSLADRRQAIERSIAHCAKLGLTAVHDAGVDLDEIAIYRALASEGKLPIRVFAMLSAREAWNAAALPPVKVTAGDGRFRVFAVKAYVDGALGSRGAALLADYSDDPGNRGLLRISPDSLEMLARICLDRGYALCTHSIGDRGNRIALDAYEHAAGEAAALSDKRFRIEHAQIIALDDIPRFARLSVIASVQPTHCTSDMPWAPTRLGSERIEGAYAWRRLLDANARLALGSDFPVEDANPLLGLYAAVTTQDLAGAPPEGYRPSERLTIFEALRGFTSDAAYAAFAEGELGRAASGYRADLSVFDRDLTSVPASEIAKATCVMTIVGGEVVWEAKP